MTYSWTYTGVAHALWNKDTATLNSETWPQSFNGEVLPFIHLNTPSWVRFDQPVHLRSKPSTMDSSCCRFSMRWGGQRSFWQLSQHAGVASCTLSQMGNLFSLGCEWGPFYLFSRQGFPIDVLLPIIKKKQAVNPAHERRRKINGLKTRGGTARRPQNNTKIRFELRHFR